MHDDHHHEPSTETETGSPVNYSMGFGAWSPFRPEECTVAEHNEWSGVCARDNKVYHGWHPPRCPKTGCSFGHDHGMNPAESPLEAVFGPMLFGIPNEVGMLAGVHMEHTFVDPVTGTVQRKEDNPGQKCLHGHRTFKDSSVAKLADGTYPPNAYIEGDVRVLFHMGSFRADAATENIHGFTYQAVFENGNMFNVSFLIPIGFPGGFTRKCDSARIEMGPHSPSCPTRVNPLQTGNSFGDRVIVEAKCIIGKISHTVSGMYHELWRTVMVLNSPVPTIKTSSFTSPRTQIINPNSAALQVNWYWNTSYIGRCFDGVTKTILYMVDIARAKLPDGTYVVKGGLPAAFRALEKLLGREILATDPECPWRGDVYGMRLTGAQFKNGPKANKPTVWYTDAEGLNPSLTPFEGSLKWEGQPTRWWVNVFGEDARMVEYPGSMEVQCSAVNTGTLSNLDPLGYEGVTAAERSKGINPHGTHMPN
jgi:hypothetical protein